MKLALILLFSLLTAQLRAEDIPPVLDEKIAGGPPQLMLNRYLLKEMAAAEARIHAELDGIDSEQKLKAWQQRLREKFVQALGGFPERTPLNTKTAGTVQRDGYRVERILFESRPAHYVTAALFLPDEKKFAPPYPGILIPCGHSKNGKAFDVYQRGAVLAAANGMAALVYDPIDQGERIQDVDADGKFKISNVNGHNRIGASAALLGWNTASFRVWDGMRAIDYLASRPEIDAKRIGCMGNSGGGTLTSYLMALDDRITAAAPSCYITTLRRVCESIGPQDAEQNIFGQMSFGMDHAQFLMMRAPLPVLVCSAQKDYFPIEGAQDAVARAKTLGARFGFEDRISRVESAGAHGWSEPLRSAGAQWMNRWLREKDELAVPPLTDMGISEEAIRVTDRGQVMLIPGARSVYDIMREELANVEKSRRKVSSLELQKIVLQRTGFQTIEERDRLLHVPRPRGPAVRGQWKREWGTIEAQTFEIKRGLAQPALYFRPDNATQQPVLWVHGLGKSHVVKVCEDLARNGHEVLAVDLTGFGETQGSQHAGDFGDVAGKDESDAVIANLLGQTLTVMRAEDISNCAFWLSRRAQKSVDLRAASWAVTPALHAVVAEPRLFSALTLTDRPPAWREVIQRGERHRFSDIVPGALRDYDLSELEAAFRELLKARTDRK